MSLRGKLLLVLALLPCHCSVHAADAANGIRRAVHSREPRRPYLSKQLEQRHPSGSRDVSFCCPQGQQDKVNSSTGLLGKPMSDLSSNSRFYPDDIKPLPMIFISIGLHRSSEQSGSRQRPSIRSRRDIFQMYIQLLAQENGDKELTPLPRIEQSKITGPKDIMNEQFEQLSTPIVGVIIGVNMAHHYPRPVRQVCEGNFR